MTEHEAVLIATLEGVRLMAQTEAKHGSKAWAKAIEQIDAALRPMPTAAQDPTEAIGRPSDADIVACCENALFDHYGMFPPESKHRLARIHWKFFEKN